MCIQNRQGIVAAGVVLRILCAITRVSGVGLSGESVTQSICAVIMNICWRANYSSKATREKGLEK